MNSRINYAFLAAVVILIFACNSSKKSNLEDPRGNQTQAIDSFPATIINSIIENPNSNLSPDATSKNELKNQDFLSIIDNLKASETLKINSEQDYFCEIQGLPNIKFQDLKIVIGVYGNINYLKHDF